MNRAILLLLRVYDNYTVGLLAPAYRETMDMIENV